MLDRDKTIQLADVVFQVRVDQGDVAGLDRLGVEARAGSQYRGDALHVLRLERADHVTEQGLGHRGVHCATHVAVGVHLEGGRFQHVEQQRFFGVRSLLTEDVRELLDDRWNIRVGVHEEIGETGPVAILGDVDRLVLVVHLGAGRGFAFGQRGQRQRQVVTARFTSVTTGAAHEEIAAELDGLGFVLG